MKWIDLVPSEFARLVRETDLCVVPMGSLERHGEHLPFGCDLVVAERIAELAAQREPCVVFPGYFLAQVHEAACFTGTVNLPQALAVEVLAEVLDGIAANGFGKILILNGHGGNSHFLNYFAMSQLDRPRAYTLYTADCFSGMIPEEQAEHDALWETEPLGHACEWETSVFMACHPGTTRLDLAGTEPVLAGHRLDHLKQAGVHSPLWWYADWPQNVVGLPAAATEEKGKKAVELMAGAVSRAIAAVKADTVAPALQREFLQRVAEKGTKAKE